MRRYLLLPMLLIVASGSAREPALRTGDSCPTGYYRAAEYCQRQGKPDYRAIPKKAGGKCPACYYGAGDSCMKQ